MVKIQARLLRLGPDNTDRLTRTLTSAGVGRGALAANWQTAAMTDATIAVDRLKPLQIGLDFTAKIAFDL